MFPGLAAQWDDFDPAGLEIDARRIPNGTNVFNTQVIRGAVDPGIREFGGAPGRIVHRPCDLRLNR